MSASCAGAMTDGCGCRGPWSRSWRGRPRWPSRSGSRRGPRATSARFRPWLEKIVRLKREESACLAGPAPADGAAGPAGSAYDPLLDEYEPGARSADLAVLFDALRRELTSAGRGDRRGDARRARPGGRRLGCSGRRRRGDPRAIVPARSAADLRRGRGRGGGLRLPPRAAGRDRRIPFCTGIGPGDCRITTRFDEHEFSDAFFGILHEVGHGLYEQGLDEAHYGTPMGEAVSLGVHESQSRLWENLVGRGRAFWAYWLPMARRIFHEALADVSLDQFHAAVNHVAPSLIRVRADEATYNLHIIIRFELEQDLLAGNLAVERPPRGLEPEVPGMPGRHAGQRRRGLPPGHPLERRADRLFPDLHPGQHLRGPALRRGPCRARRPRRRLRPRRFRRPARLAPREDPPPGPALSVRRPGRARHRLPTRPSPPDRRPAAEVCRAVWNLTNPPGRAPMKSTEAISTLPDPPPPMPSAATSVATAPPPLPPSRLASIDAYRGLVMFLMMAEVLRLCARRGHGAGQQALGVPCAITSRTRNGLELDGLLAPRPDPAVVLVPGRRGVAVLAGQPAGAGPVEGRG